MSAPRAAIRTALRAAFARLGGKPSELPAGDVADIYAAFEDAGADAELLAVVGSIDDTLTDDEVLRYLREIDAGRPVIAEVVAADRPRREG